MGREHKWELMKKMIQILRFVSKIQIIYFDWKLANFVVIGDEHISLRLIDFGHSYTPEADACSQKQREHQKTKDQILNYGLSKKFFLHSDATNHLIGDFENFARVIKPLFSHEFKNDPVAQAAACYLRGMKQWKQHQPKTGAEAVVCLDALCDFAMNANDQDYKKLAEIKRHKIELCVFNEQPKDKKIWGRPKCHITNCKKKRWITGGHTCRNP